MSNGKRGINKTVNSAVSAAVLRECWDPYIRGGAGCGAEMLPTAVGGQEKALFLHACR